MTQDYPSNKEKCNRNEAEDKITKVKQLVLLMSVTVNFLMNEVS